MVVDIPFILLVEEAVQQNHKAVLALFDEAWFVKEGMRVYEGTLVASFHEEEMINHQVSKLEGELSKLMEKNKELQSGIQEDITILLDKRCTLLALESRQRELRAAIGRIMDDLETSKRCKQTIEDMWVDANDARISSSLCILCFFSSFLYSL
ncbi:hypothetical protein A2U01_0002193 [Trifolium medium]|uniref:Uncharacterized protein n=1 Tax=Trifolium medium TaxID=97028 RepID=A0A392M2B4_9FABA|nr:hypothetical protein [Trifolium medium]